MVPSLRGFSFPWVVGEGAPLWVKLPALRLVCSALLLVKSETSIAPTESPRAIANKERLTPTPVFAASNVLSLHFPAPKKEPPPSGGSCMCRHCKSAYIMKRGVIARTQGKPRKFCLTRTCDPCGFEDGKDVPAPAERAGSRTIYFRKKWLTSA